MSKEFDVLVIGAGVAGLAAIGAARGLGAIVRAFDTRPAVKEQVESMGAEYLTIEFEEDGTGAGGYGKQMSEAFMDAERALFEEQAKDVDIIITTALIPGRPAPRIITAEMVASMKPGSVIVDLAAERGGNCELTRLNETVVEHGVTILGPVNLPAMVPHHASQMYARNMSAFLQHVVKDREIQIDPSDEIVCETLLTRGGKVVHPRIREALGLAPVTARDESTSERGSPGLPGRPAA